MARTAREEARKAREAPPHSERGEPAFDIEGYKRGVAEAAMRRARGRAPAREDLASA